MRSVQNVSQSVKVPLVSLLPEDKRPNLENPETLEENLQQIEALKENMKVSEDEVEFRLTSGHVVFDIYAQNQAKPAAPIALKRAEAELLQLAKSFIESSFTVPKKVADTVANILSEDSLFKAATVNAEFDSLEGSKSIALSAQILYFVPLVLEAVLDAVTYGPQESGSFTPENN
jgi:hypothetical protein